MLKLETTGTRYINLPVFILAYDNRQADFCAKFVLKIREKNKYRIVSDENSLLGYRDKVLYLYGTWFRRRDSEILIQVAKSREFRIIEIEDNR